MVVRRSSKAWRWVGVGMVRVGTVVWPCWMSLRVRVARWSSRLRKLRIGWWRSLWWREALRVPDGHVFCQPWPAGTADKRRDQVIYYECKADRARRTLLGIDEQIA